MRHVVFSLTIFISLSLLNAVSKAESTDEVLQMFEKNCLAVVLSDGHGVRSNHKFRMQLLNNPDFPNHIDTIAIEFGSAFYQDRLDRWLLELEEIPDDDVREIWRDTQQLLVWDSPIYEEFLRRVRVINEGLIREKRIRVVGMAPGVE